MTALEHTDWLDRMLIISALVFFGLVVLFVLKQRILDRGLRIAFWWTKFVPGFGDARGRITGETLKEVAKNRATGSSLTSVVMTATAVSSTLASVLAATTALPGHTEDPSPAGESVLLSSVASVSAAAFDPQNTPVAHAEL